jgi:hypothetical protein
VYKFLWIRNVPVNDTTATRVTNQNIPVTKYTPPDILLQCDGCNLAQVYRATLNPNNARLLYDAPVGYHQSPEYVGGK